MDKCVPGASVRELCIMGDKTILDKAGKRFKNDTKMSKGNDVVKSSLLLIIDIIKKLITNLYYKYFNFHFQALPFQRAFQSMNAYVIFLP